MEELSPRLVEELTKDVRTAIEKHDKEILKVIMLQIWHFCVEQTAILCTDKFMRFRFCLTFYYGLLFSQVQKDFAMLGRSILILSGHQSEQLRVASTTDPSEKLVKILEGLGDDVPIVLPDTLHNKRSSKLFSGAMPDTVGNGTSLSSKAAPLSARHTLVGLDQMDDNLVFETIAVSVFSPPHGNQDVCFTTSILWL